jgi:chromosome segregation ATPase
MKNAKTIIIAFLLGITVFCVYKYIVSVKENYDLSSNIHRLNTDIKALEDEKDGVVKDLDREKEINKALDQENAWAKENLNQTQAKLSQLATDYQSSQKAIDDLSSQISLVKAENTALRDQIQSLELDINQAKADKEQLQSRLSSIAELKKAIKELRRKTRQIKKQVKRRIVEKQELILGNSGFLIKEGQPTGKSKIKIEVEPLPGNQ